MAVDGAAVQHLDHQLQVGVVEEPEGAGVGRQRHRLPLPRDAAGERPVDLDPEARAVQAEMGGVGEAAPLRQRRDGGEPERREEGQQNR